MEKYKLIEASEIPNDGLNTDPFQMHDSMMYENEDRNLKFEDDQEYNAGASLKDFYMRMNTEMDPRPEFKQKKNEFMGDLTKESSDMLKFVDWNERRHRVDALAFLKEQSLFTKEAISTDIHQHRLTEETPFKTINARINRIKEVKGSTMTSINSNETFIFIGTSNSELQMFYKAT